MVIKYKVEKTFKDKYSKEIIKENDIIEVTIERMKELNAKKFGRVIDIILDADEQENVTVPDENKTVVDEENKVENDEDTDEKNKSEGNKETYTKEQLENMTVNQLKDLAEKLGCELTKAKKDEIVSEILEFQNK